MFKDYIKQKDILVCIDSDGCVIDSMTWKHKLCFGPLFIDIFGLDFCKDYALSLWENINLYSRTRGINRFKALGIVLKELIETQNIDLNISKFIDWIETSNELSNNSLLKYNTINDNVLNKTYQWSIAVNEKIKQLSNNSKPFSSVANILSKLSDVADIAVISSANREAVLDEWGKFELLQYTKIVCTQENGSKAYCIKELLKFEYDVNKVVMIGDSLGDLDASQQNGILFYPILFEQENQSWEKVMDSCIYSVMNNDFNQNKQEEYNKRLLDHLS